MEEIQHKKDEQGNYMYRWMLPIIYDVNHNILVVNGTNSSTRSIYDKPIIYTQDIAFNIRSTGHKPDGTRYNRGIEKNTGVLYRDEDGSLKLITW